MIRVVVCFSCMVCKQKKEQSDGNRSVLMSVYIMKVERYIFRGREYDELSSVCSSDMVKTERRQEEDQ
jgi:hypothetical protein